MCVCVCVCVGGGEGGYISFGFNPICHDINVSWCSVKVLCMYY